METDREMQLCVVVEHIVGGQLVQLSQHAQAVVGLRFLLSKEERFLCLRRKKDNDFFSQDGVLNLDMVKPVGEDFQHCVQSSPGLLLENLK